MFYLTFTVSNKTSKFSFFVRELLMGVAVVNIIEPLVNKEFHTQQRVSRQITESHIAI